MVINLFEYGIFDLHTSKAGYELQVVLLHLWLVNVKTSSRIYLHSTR
jgi:hypothetical protein